MGMQHEISYTGDPPTWTAIRGKLIEVGESPQMRMIDGELALPDEEPPESWQELRIKLNGGMVTLSRSAGKCWCTTWGNADANLRLSWDQLTWATADAAETASIDGVSINEFIRVNSELALTISQRQKR